MSFILEALKKSEQQRQQQNMPPQKLRKRTLSLSSTRPERRLLPWLLCICLLLLLLGGWLLFPWVGATPEPPLAMVQEQKVVAPPPKPVTAEVVEPTPVVTSGPQKTVAAVEPAPVPRPLGASQTDPVAPPAENGSGTAQASRQVDAPIPQRMQSIDKPVATVIMEQPEPRAIKERTVELSAVKLPLYNELPREWLDRIPKLEMSLHFYTPEPSRRIVRINDHLLHEGNWVDRNLQVVEITTSGAVLDYLGKSFELRRNRR